MQRIALAPRANWQQRVEAVGFTFHTYDTPYWNEHAYYLFHADELDMLETVANDLHQMCLEAVDYIIRQGWCERMGVPGPFVDFVVQSWQRRDPWLYGRFDLHYDGHNPPRLLEYNADTPTSLLEASVVQWHWLNDCFPERDQFNTIHEHLLAGWQSLRQSHIHDQQVAFVCVEEELEDLITTEYLRDVAIQAGCTTQQFPVEQIGWHPTQRAFVDLDDAAIRCLFKLYPWEWLFAEPFGEHLLVAPFDLVLEPPWKVLLSSKALLPVLWERFPNHPNLLPAAFADPDYPDLPDQRVSSWLARHTDGWVSKPRFGREGEGVTIHQPGKPAISSPLPSNEPRIFQAYAPLPCFAGHYPVLGAWVVGNKAAGIGIRESSLLITDNESNFVPHCCP